MKTLFAMTAASAALISSAALATPLYSFETGTQGFVGLGGATVAASAVVGATDGVGALSYNTAAAATFTVARNETNVPAALSNVQTTAISFDVTKLTQYAGAFADFRITVFGASQPGPDQQFGLQVESTTSSNFSGLPIGTTTVTVQLIGTNPLTFDTNQNYFAGPTAIFGTGPNQLIPTAFQLVLSKSGDAAASFFIDNIRTNVVPEPASLGLLGLAGTLLTRRRRA